MTAPSKTTPLGCLVLVPNTLDLGSAQTPIQDVLSMGALKRSAELRHWVVENAKTTRAFLKRVDAVVALSTPLQSLVISELPRPPKGANSTAIPSAKDWEALLAPALAGHDIGLLSEAGLPAVADPGALLVRAAHGLSLTVEPLAGSSSLTLALAASGLNGQRFAFEGYLPQQAEPRTKRVRELEQRSRKEGQTQLVIETPYRNNALWSALVQTLGSDTRLSVACGLTCPGGWCMTRTVAQWRNAGPSPSGGPLPDHLPAVFMWLAS